MTERPYRAAVKHEEVEKLKKCGGSQFDLHLVQIFIKLLSEKDDTGTKKGLKEVC